MVSIRIHWAPACMAGAFFVLTVLIQQGCLVRAPLPVYEHPRICYALEIAEGLGDFVLDQWNGSPRLLISACDRRKPGSTGEIYYMDLKTAYAKPLPREGEAQRIYAFKPRRMDIRHQQDKTWVYVLLEEPYGDKGKGAFGIGIYRVSKAALAFEALLETDDYMPSPNDLSVTTSGDIYVSNGTRSGWGTFLRRKSSEISFYNAETQSWETVAEELEFAGGILATRDVLFVAQTWGDCVTEFPVHPDGRLGEGKKIADIKGPDSISGFNGSLLLTAHFNDVAYWAHKRDPEFLSPSVVVMIDPEKKGADTMQTLYVDEGTQLSAAGAALVWNHKLYISSAFSNRIVICEADDLP